MEYTIVRKSRKNMPKGHYKYLALNDKEKDNSNFTWTMFKRTAKVFNENDALEACIAFKERSKNPDDICLLAMNKFNELVGKEFEDGKDENDDEETVESGKLAVDCSKLFKDPDFQKAFANLMNVAVKIA